MTHQDAHEVHPGLFVGSMPREGSIIPADLLVLCAMEYQPPARMFLGRSGSPLRVLHAPFDDSTAYTAAMHRVAHGAARKVAETLKAGGTALVTCAEGRNRSALVAGLAMVRLGVPGRLTVQHIRTRRHPPRGGFALSNPAFADVLSLA
jgi:protein-tyrosine phosphatase